jgi:hypothetical protein
VNGKVLQRSKNQQYIEDNTLGVANNQQTYKKRQAIVEHPFGTIKRQWGFDHIRTKKSKRRASADVGLIFIAYNLKRILKVIGGKNVLSNTINALYSHIISLVRGYAERLAVKTYFATQPSIFDQNLLLLNNYKNKVGY